MLNTHRNFHSANGKRLVLIVDDEAINRELLNLMLQDKYEAIFAADGESALNLIRENHDVLSLILLDLLMPGMNGLELLRIVKNDQELKDIPVIVLTADQEAEVSSLRLGASDFIPKPYPKQDIILARVERAIELSEDTDTIRSTERDSITELYNREYFFHYAHQFDQHHKELEMDAIVVNVYHFRMINERYGRAFGDHVLQRIGLRLREKVRDTGGIVCRREADTFLIYCPHREDYEDILAHASVRMSEDASSANSVRLRMGVYARVDKRLEMERRFDRAKMAADTVRSNFLKGVALYDDKLHESEIYEEHLLEDFQEALRSHQFMVYYQPKFDIRPEIPVLASAEALVRWQHPDLGMISPAVFIPLFEKNGYIQKLDTYVWKEAAAQIRDWKERFGISVPVSVNVSRIDMYDPDLIDTFQALLDAYSLEPRELLLEITESAYTQDSAQIIRTVNGLRDIGFHIEMDDFGTGYSSLNMISSLPIDALKLDMKFIRNAFRDGRDTRLIEVIIDIADYLSVPVIAEGVETKEQLDALHAMGCDLVQGYYFSKPVPAEDYETFVEQRAQQEESAEGELSEDEVRSVVPDHAFSASIAHALTSGSEVIYYVDMDTNHYVQFSAQGKYEDLQIERSGRDFFADTERNIRRVIYRDDRDRVALFMQKETLMTQLVGDSTFSMTYRLLIDGQPLYYNLRAVRAQGKKDHHIVIGISNVEEQIRQASESTEGPDRNHEFFSIAQALSSDFESIYYVDTETDSYTEFTAQGSYESLQIELSGQDFFRECQENLRTVVYTEDQPLVRRELQKEVLLETLEQQPSYSVLYRLMIGDKPTWYQMKIVRTDDKRHIVIGVSNVENQMTRENEYLRSQKESVTFSGIAQALAADYFSIYYVNTRTDEFVEFSADDDYRALEIENGGGDFFNLSRKNILRVVHPDDHEKILDVFTKDKLLDELEKTGTFTLTYRLIQGDKTSHVSMKATRMASEEDPHIVIGVNSIDAQVHRQEEFDAIKAQSMTYSRVAEALSQDYFSIYVVNAETDEFIEYSSSNDYRELQVEQSGVSFFEDCRRNILRLVYKEDLDLALSVWDKSRLMPELESGKSFSSTYRLMMDQVPVYINCKANLLESEEDGRYIVIGVSNVDAQMRRERELSVAREKANRDALTGVKSKHAYTEKVEEINAEIASGSAEPFAVAVCDVNGLKTVNDTLGHQAGDQLIMEASRSICETFKHSPVYRIGGDEFLAILRGHDYEQRDALFEDMMKKNARNRESGGVIIACGIASRIPEKDESFESVFMRADAAMYENKTSLKDELLR